MHPAWRDNCKIVVVGGGIGGTATAIGLALEGFQVEILEASPSPQEIGAGIEIPPNASRILYAYGLRPVLEPLVLEGAAIQIRSWKSGQIISTTPLGSALEQRYGAPHMNIHRADLLAVLSKHASDLGVTIKYNAAVSNVDFPSRSSWNTDITPDKPVEHPPKVLVSLQNGELIAADCVIGADGQRSRIRAILTGISDPLRRSGDMTYRVTIPTDVLRRNLRLQGLVDPPNVNAWLGPHGHVVAYPVKKDDQYNIFLGGQDDQANEAGPPPPPTVVQAQEAKGKFQHWDSRLIELLDACPRLLKWTLLVQDSLLEWTHPSGRMTLMGDAAHAMLPYLGQGAAQALEDAATIATLLGRCTDASQMPAALRAYEQLRQPRAAYIKERAWQMRDVVGLPDGPRQEARDRAMAREPFEGCPNPTVDPVLQEWLWGYDAFAEARQVPIGDL